MDPEAASEEGAPTPLAAIEAEATLERRWQVGVGRGLGRKYLRIAPTILGRSRLRGGRLWDRSGRRSVQRTTHLVDVRG